MAATAETIGPDASLQKAAASRGAMGMGSLPVCAGRRLVGAITDRDRIVVAPAPSGRTGQSPVEMLVRRLHDARGIFLTLFEDGTGRKCWPTHGEALQNQTSPCGARQDEEPESSAHQRPWATSPPSRARRGDLEEVGEGDRHRGCLEPVAASTSGLARPRGVSKWWQQHDFAAHPSRRALRASSVSRNGRAASYGCGVGGEPGRSLGHQARS